MTQAERFVRRNRVDERYALSIAALAGLVAATAGARPTGSAPVDVVLVFVSVAAVVWASASAPWWVSAAACGVAAVVAFDPVVAAVGAAGFIGGLVIGLRHRDQSELRAVVGAIAMNVLIRSELHGFFGLSAIIGISLAVAVFVMGLRRRPSAVRRRGWIAAGSVGAVSVVALLALGAAAATARPNLTRGASQANQAIDVLNQGDYELAAELFSQASTAFRSADNQLGGILTAPSRLIPVVSQNVVAGADLAEAASLGTADAAGALRAIDPSSLQVVDGAIDLDAVAAVEAPLLDVQEALSDLRLASEGVESPWLLAPVQDELIDLDERLDKNEPRLVNAIDAVRLAPQMLGADGQRRYLVLFTTPVEARGIAGFIGNYADITVTDGRIEVTEFGRRSDLEAVVRSDGATCTGCPEELLARYGRFGLDSGPGGAAIPTVWANLTMPAHFPFVAEAATVLYPQSGGSPIDGVISLDPYVIAALMAYTGPIEVPELGVTVSTETAAQFILEDQYILAGNDANADRIDALQTLGEGVIDRLLTGSLPEPSTLARDLGPLAAEHRLMVWTGDPEEQGLLDRTGMLGAMPELGDDGGFAVFAANTGESKIDVFLEREVDVRIEIDDAGNQTLIADVTLTNNAPPSGLPRYVIGNGFGLPEGTSRLWLSFYGPPGLETVTRNGEEVAVSPNPEAGWLAYSVNDVIGPGGSVDYHLEFALQPALEPADEPSGEPTEWWQPLARRDP